MTAAEQTAKCDQCGADTPINDLDAKPERLVGRRNTRRQLKKALARNEDFTRLECRGCYGPGFVRAES
jgi:hypothetical protein